MALLVFCDVADNDTFSDLSLVYSVTNSVLNFYRIDLCSLDISDSLMVKSFIKKGWSDVCKI